MIIHGDIVQRSYEWHLLRRGRITASQFSTVANGTKSGREALCWAVAKERIDQVAEEPMAVNDAMQWGIDREPESIGRYEWENNTNAEEVGFCEYDDLFGFSPDRLVMEDGGIEAKCPQEKTYKELAKKFEKASDWLWIPSKHRWQIQASLYMSSREWWDYVVYYPDMPLLVYRVTPDNDSFSKIKDGMELCRNWVESIEGAKHGNV